ncbi:MAG: DNA repair protein [Lachnospiraceae bacterium]|nr:DNA repair protein [Lachnospiraceae bacterium]
MRETERSFICIDLKSFYASVECVERGLDPFETDLVVADPSRSKSTICLAITPAMKKKGVKNRCRMHEIPPGMEFITARPRMQLYIDYSAWIYSIYLQFVAPEDIHVYSIDECFLDVSSYLELYHWSAKEMACELMKAVFRETGITATAGVGSNLYLAKIAMDILAKHAEDHIGVLDEYSYRKRLWGHRPMTDFWRIGSGTERRLARYGLYTMGDVARASLTSEDFLWKQFGVDAELLIDHAWGVENCRMEDIKKYTTRQHSLSNGQVLMRNYAYSEALVIMKEMTDNLTLDLVKKRLAAESFTIWISYDHRFEVPHSGGTVNMGTATNSSKRIRDAVEQLFLTVVDRYTGIRRLGICANKVVAEGYLQYDLFSDPREMDRERSLQEAILNVHGRYGKNAIMRGSSLLDCSTYRERNMQIGGHWA